MKPFSAGGGFATLAAGHAGEESRRPAQPPTQPSHRWILPSPLLPKATAAKTTAQEKESCWILLLLAPAAVGASLRSPLAMRGRRAADSTTTITTITTVDFALAAVAEGDSRKNNSTRKKISCWILLLLAPAAVGASLRSPLAMRGEPSPLLPKATAAKNNSTRKKISCWILLLLSPAAVGASLRSPMAMRGRRAAAARTAEQPEQPNSRTARTAEQPNSRTTRTAEQPEQPNSPNSCRRFRPLPFPRPLPSSSPSRSCLS